MRLKKLLTVVLICFALAGLAAVDLDYHLGAGLAIPFIESQETIGLPHVYGGLGVNIIPPLAVGAEYEVFGLYFFGYGFLVHLPKAYVKYDINEYFTLSALGGVAVPTIFTPETATSFSEENMGIAGIRATAFFMYGEYLFLINQNAPISLITVGIAIKR